MAQTFKETIYSLTRMIPRGKVASYGQLARLAGKANAARAVGAFMKSNPNAPHTPCHRVVSQSGLLTGYSAEGGLRKKREMLIDEGVIFNGMRVNMKKSLWSGIV